MKNTSKPWYKNVAPWLLFMGPILVVFASIYTAWLAARIDDGMVVDDYYQEGKSINQVLTRDNAATQGQLQATVWLGQNNKDLRLLLQYAPTFKPGEHISLRFQHPTQSAADITLPLKEIAPNTYEARSERTLSGRWYVSVEEPRWRLTGEWVIQPDSLLLLKPK